MDFDVFLKLRVLHTLTTWTFWNADRIRDKMPEKRETDQLEWVSRFPWELRFDYRLLTSASALKSLVGIAKGVHTTF